MTIVEITFCFNRLKFEFSVEKQLNCFNVYLYNFFNDIARIGLTSFVHNNAMHGPEKYPFSKVSSLRYFVRYLFCTFLRYKTNIVQSIVRSNRNSWAKRLKVVHWHIALIHRRQTNPSRVLVRFGPYHFEVLHRYSISHNFVLIHIFENN